MFCVGSAERNVPTWMRNGDTFEERRRRIEGGTLMNEQDRSAVRKLDKGKQYSADKKKYCKLHILTTQNHVVLSLLLYYYLSSHIIFTEAHEL